MDAKKIMEILENTAYIRMGGSDEELRCATYLRTLCEELGLDTRLEAFDVEMADIETATLEIDGVSIPCTGYHGAGCAELEAPLYYMTTSDKYALSQCRGKIVMIDGLIGKWKYRDMLDNGALGFITYTGSANYADCDIAQRELRSYVCEGNKIPGVNINVKSAIEIIQNGGKTAKIVLKQNEYTGKSHNVIAELPGELDETIVLSAHYDSTSLSQGAYDNMSGCIGLLGIAEYFTKHSHRYGLRFIFCGSEERGLLGAKAYCAAHESELGSIVLNINLDMIGCIMGHFIACCTSESKLVDYISYMGLEYGRSISTRQDVYSSDSTPFADKGIPAVSFARIAPHNTATIHNSYDTLAVIKPAHMLEDIDFISAFTERMACAVKCPVAREMPDNMKEKLDTYLLRKRSK